MRLFRLAAVDWFVSFGLRQQLDLCGDVYKRQKLGFLGGMAVPAVIRYGYGYVDRKSVV